VDGGRRVDRIILLLWLLCLSGRSSGRRSERHAPASRPGREDSALGGRANVDRSHLVRSMKRTRFFFVFSVFGYVCTRVKCLFSLCVTVQEVYDFGEFEVG
jgi:hypothetical protein